MRILQTPIRYPPATGGVETYVQSLSRELVRRGHEVTVVCANEPAGARRETVDGVTVVRLPYQGKISNTNISAGLLPELFRQNFDVLHAHIATPWTPELSALAALARRKPLVTTYHNDILRDGGGAAGRMVDVYNRTLLPAVLSRSASILITQPSYLEYSRYLAPHREKVAVVPIGVDPPTSPVAVPRSASRLFFLSILDRHHEYKGLGVLLEAVALARDANPDITLEVGGRGELLGRYRKQATALGLNDRVTFLGYVPAAELALRYAGAAAFVLPSVNNLEGFGIVALEAMAHGTPVITTTLTGSAGPIEEVGAGLIVPPGDRDALVAALVKLTTDAGGARAMGERGAALVAERFTWRAIGETIEDIYREHVR